MSIPASKSKPSYQLEALHGVGILVKQYEEWRHPGAQRLTEAYKNFMRTLLEVTNGLTDGSVCKEKRTGPGIVDDPTELMLAVEQLIDSVTLRKE